MITEKQQARHDIDVCKASLRAVIKQVSSIKGAYSTPMDNRVNCYLLSALNELTKIYDEDWIDDDSSWNDSLIYILLSFL